MVIEAKADSSVNERRAFEELEQARKNRGASAGVMVFHPNALGSVGLQSVGFKLAPTGQDVLIVWNPDDPMSDGMLRAGMALARNYCARERQLATSTSLDINVMQKAVADIQDQVDELSVIEKSAETVRKEADRLDGTVLAMRVKVGGAVNILIRQFEQVSGS